MRRDSVPWARVRDSAFVLADGAQRPYDTYPAIQWALRRVNRHSFLQVPAPGAVSTLIEQRFAYIHVPQRSGEGIPLADSLQTAVRSLQEARACGWIVDLRANGGGNMWPMLAGIGPLLGDSIVGRFGGQADSARWYYKAGVSGILSASGKLDTVTRTTVPAAPMQDVAAPVAVLLDAQTASSGEAVAIAFTGRPNTRMFGTRTAGYATVNRGARLPDGANMVVTTGYSTDRTGHQYGEQLAPDSIVEVPSGWPSATDRVTAAAVHWLKSREACARGS
jgi:C-terminal processing protease CtpA/Prc